jgi:hypothetical protein
MKKYFFALLLMASVSVHAQFHIVPVNNDISNALSKVLTDYPDHFDHIKGNIIDQDVQTIDYSCTVNIPGADSSVITQNGPTKDNIYSWKSVLFTTDDFDKVKTKFHEYYSRVKAINASAANKKITLQGEYIAPDDSKRFATILFTPAPATDALRDVVVDLSLQYLLSGWQISVSVYEHKDYGIDQQKDSDQ